MDQSAQPHKYSRRRVCGWAVTQDVKAQTTNAGETSNYYTYTFNTSMQTARTTAVTQQEDTGKQSMTYEQLHRWRVEFDLMCL